MTELKHEFISLKIENITFKNVVHDIEKAEFLKSTIRILQLGARSAMKVFYVFISEYQIIIINVFSISLAGVRLTRFRV